MVAVCTVSCALGGGVDASSANRSTTAEVKPKNAPGNASSTKREARRATFRALTFNAGLAVGLLPHATERVEPVVSSLATFPADAVCVQEVWLEPHWRELKQAAEPRLPHALRPDPIGTNEQSCTRAELDPAIRCVKRHCADTASIASCAVRSCGDFARQLSPECVSCLMKDPLRTLGEVKKSCLARPAASTLAPSVRSGTTGNRKPLVYGGSYGIGLLTSAQVLDSDFLPLESEGIARGVLYAELATPLIGTLHVFCTHLTTAAAPYPLASGSAANEQAREIDRLLSFVERKAGRAPTLVLGDLNTGPAAGSGIRPVLPQHYARFVAAGFVDPYLEQPEPACTFCYANPVQASPTGRGGGIIDHALLRNIPFAFDAARVLDQPIELDLGGRRIQTAYSDHYGVLVVMRSAAS